MVVVVIWIPFVLVVVMGVVVSNNEYYNVHWNDDVDGCCCSGFGWKSHNHEMIVSVRPPYHDDVVEVSWWYYCKAWLLFLL